MPRSIINQSFKINFNITHLAFWRKIRNYNYCAGYTSSECVSSSGKIICPRQNHMKEGEVNIMVGKEIINLKEVGMPKLG